MREQVKRRWSCPDNWLLGMANDLREDCCNVRVRTADISVFDAEKRCCFLLIPALVELGIFKADAETSESIPSKLSREACGQTGIKPSAQVCSDGHIRTQPKARSIRQKGKQFLCGSLLIPRCFRIRLIFMSPVPRDSHFPVLNSQRVPRRQLRNISERCPRRQGDPEREDLIQSSEIEFSSNIMALDSALISDANRNLLPVCV